VGKRTKQDLADERALTAAGHPIPARRLERWRAEEELGPMSEDPARRVEHILALVKLAARGRSSDRTALLLASRGFPTRRYLKWLASPEGLALDLLNEAIDANVDEADEPQRVAQMEDEAKNALGAMASGPFAEIAEQMRTNIAGHGGLATREDPLGGQYVILEDIGRGIHGLDPDPAAPARLGDTLPPEMGAPDAFMMEIAVALLGIGPAVITEAARLVRDEPEEIARAAVELRGLLDDPDNEATAIEAARNAPLLLASKNVVPSALEPLVQKAGLSTEDLSDYVGLPPKPT
jgi:hypothetical protein